MKTIKRILLAGICITSFLPIAKGQYPRKVLIEFFTNAGCPPCVQANIDINNQCAPYPNDVILLKYHCQYPGYDMFFNDNPAMNQARINYYGVQAIPNYFVDGWGQPNFNARLAIPSPFEVKTTYSVFDNPSISLKDSVTITTTVKAGTNVFNGNLKLRTVAVLKYYGLSQGLFNEFHQVVRDMAPDSNGTTLPWAFFAGDSVVYSYKIALDDKYDLHQLQIVSFVQDDTTNEVQQAAVGVEDPLFKITPVSGYKSYKMVNANGLAALHLPFRIQTKNAANFKFTLLPQFNNNAGWSQNMIINGSTGNLYNLQLTANTDTVIDVSVNVMSTISLFHSTYIADITIQNTAFPNGSYLDFDSHSPDYFYIAAYSKCLNVINAGQHAIQLANVFDHTGNPYLVIEQPLPGIDTVNFNKASVKNFFVSYNYDTLRSELPLMTNLLNSGGNVSIEGDIMHRDVSYLNAPPGVLNFYNNYMGALFNVLNTQSSTIDAVTTDSYYGIIPSMGPYTGYIFGTCAPYSSTPNSTPIFHYNNGPSIAGLRNTNGNFKTALFGFYFGNISVNYSYLQGMLLQSTLNWFSSPGTTGINESTANFTNTDFYNTPNPGQGSTTIHLPPSSNSRMLKVIDVSGRVVALEKIAGNQSHFVLNVSKLSNGIYTYSIVEDGKAVYSKKLVVEN